MGTKRMRMDEDADALGVPPGFVSLTSFRLVKAADGSSNGQNCDSGEGEISRMGEGSSVSDVIDTEMLKESFQHRPWILHQQGNHSHPEESVAEPANVNLPLRTSLPKGVHRGCLECSTCLKATARWRPEEAKIHILEEAPVFRPTEEVVVALLQEFRDTLKYIASLRERAGAYGICRIVPPPSWQLPCIIKEKKMWEGSSFIAQIQRIGDHKIQREKTRSSTCRSVSYNRRSNARMGVEVGVGNGYILDPREVGMSDIEGLESQPRPEFTLETFKKYADDFKGQYFSTSNSMASDVDTNMHQRQWELSGNDIEYEYVRMVGNPTEEIEVLYGETPDSGFPTIFNSSSMSEYLNSGWNLNNTPKLSGSLLSFESSKTSGVLVPRLRIGMCFSSIGWKVEEHHLHFLCYMHLGSPKIWYGLPGRYKVKFEIAMKKCLPDILLEQPWLCKGLVPQPFLSALKLEKLPVYRCIQYPGEFVLVFPGVYYSGLDCGFNCTEAVNVAPLDWLAHGQNVGELYCAQGTKTSISYDKMLLGAAREAVRAQWETSLLTKKTLNNSTWREACGKDGILAKAFRSRIKLEGNRRECLCPFLEPRRMDQDYDDSCKRECSICFYDLHLSAIWCPCSADKYSCLNHAKQLCSCPWSEKIFLFRYDISELNLLAEALEGKLSAVYKWAREDIKVVLHAPLSVDGSTAFEHAGGPESVSKKPEGEQNFHHEATPRSSAKDEIKAPLVQSSSFNDQKFEERIMASSSLSFGAADDSSSKMTITILSNSSSISSSSDMGTSDM